MRPIKLGLRLIFLLLLNWTLLIFYFAYITQDQDFSINETKLFINSIFEHHIQESNTQDQNQIEIQIEMGGEEEFEFAGEDEREIQFIDDPKGDLIAVGDDNLDTNYDYTIQAIKDINPIEQNILGTNEPIRQQTQLNILKDNHYCELNNLYVITHHQLPINIITDYPNDNVITFALGAAGQDLLPDVILESNKLYHLPFNATIFFMENLNFHKYFEIGSQFLCNFQAYNHIPGIEVLFKKSSLYEILQKTEVPIPETFIMNNTTQCQQYFKQYKNLEESEYLIKNHIKRQVQQQSLDHKFIRRKYQDGKNCGIVIDDLIIQKKVENRQKRFFAMLLISFLDPFQYQIFDGFYYKIQKGVPVDHQRYNETISKMITGQIEQFIHKIPILKDNRFFSLMRMEFIEADQIYLMSITPNIDKDAQIKDYMTSLIVSTLQLINFQQIQRVSLYQIENHYQY
ncbi:unnamed protein product (macronuclear) [Paramecium tetraurelia]|uniref:Transmembrane protein n=1 Tax=Paramecium tetraurelia TaxID=5888 RepID=A0DWB7_PARTE|nr:uncharacterized protein GSPATT00020976001 [Paramecium tetraurelia]CAK87334.1 unnamed protein product [Paramecium tetraurelia]|eukprot:XP_001454731.1 hypothetical protein (macronuclear) [Paramecium tetraurelia strain d4-2]